MVLRPARSSRSSLFLSFASAIGIFCSTLVAEISHARYCDGSTNDQLVAMKKGLEDYKRDPLAFHEAKLKFESVVYRNCDSPIKSYVAGSDYAKLQTNAYQEAAKASAKKAIDFASYIKNDDQNVVRLAELKANITDFAMLGGTSRESVLREAGVSEKALEAASTEAYRADLRKLVERLEDAEKILKMQKREDFSQNFKSLVGKENSPSVLIGRFEDAKEHLETADVPEDLRKRVAALDEARLTKIYAMEKCRIIDGKPDYLNCADSLARKMMKQSDNEIAPLVKAANESSGYHQQGEAKLMEVQRRSSQGTKGSR